MNFLQSWILMKILVILLFLSGLLGVLRLFLHPDISNLATFISLTAFFTGISSLFFILRAERRLSKKYKHLGINFWDLWQDVDD